MRRDYFDVNVRTGDDEQVLPVVAISFDGPTGELSERLSTDDASEIDVTYRRTEAPEDGDPDGVLSVADRLTGEFVLEANVDPDVVDSLVSSAKRADGDEACYRIRLTDEQGKSTVYDKETLLVYDPNGSLLRQRSLIPSGVEL